MKHTVRILCIVLMAILVCVGLAACKHKEAADHTATGEWLSDETHHWHACEKEKCADAGDRAEHVYDNACDAECNTCAYKRTPAAHVYDNACDTSCNVCGATRTITHAHGTTLTAGDTTHYYACSVCGDKKDEAAHVFDKTVASSEYLKAAATATTKAQYYKSCVCGKASATEYFETDKTAGTLANIQDLSKTYDKVELANPTYETNSDGVVTIEWYQGDTKLDAKPVNAGTYKVKVIIAESATYAGISAEKEFTIAKKVLSGLSVDLPYAGTNSFEVPLGSINGILAGDVADGIKVCITFANKNVGAAVTGAGLDAEDGNNYTNYELDLTTCTANIVKRPVWAENVAFTYDGYTNWTGEESPDQIVFQNMASGETMDSSFVEWTFDSKNVGATLASVTFVDEDDGRSNYTIDFSKCTASIVKKVLSNLEAEFVYNGSAVQTSPALVTANGVVAGDTDVVVKATFANKNAGASVTGAVLESASGAHTNYELDLTTCTASIVKKVLNNVTYNFTYNGSDYQQVVLTSADLSGIIGSDEITLEVCFVDTIVGAAVDTSSPEMAPVFNDDNYTLGTYSFSIVPKTLQAERLIDYTISKTYDGTNVFTQSLSTTHGILDGDTVSVSFAVTEWDGTNDVPLIDSDTYEGGLYTASDVTLTGESAGNYVLNTDGVDITQGYTIEIFSKAITLGNEGISFTLVPDQKVYECTLTPAHGIAANETVIMRVEFTNAAVGASVKPAGVKFLVGGTEVVNYHLTSTDNIKLVS